MKEPSTCTFPKCRKKVLARELCCNHYKALTKTRTVSDGQLFNYNQLMERLLRIEDPFKRAMLTTAYLFSSRKSEALLLKKKDFSNEMVEGQEYLICNSPVKKNRKEKRKLFPVNMNAEKEFSQIVMDWIKPLQDDDYLFLSIKNRFVKRPIDKKTFYRYCIACLGIDFNPHWLRKLRCTHLINGVQNKEGTDWLIPPQPAHIIRRLMGWTDLRPFRAYERFMLTDTVRSLRPQKTNI